MTSQRERTVAEMTHAQPWLPSPTADDVITLGATIGTFEAVVFFFYYFFQKSNNLSAYEVDCVFKNK